MANLSVAEWDGFLTNHSDAHLLQTSAWGDFKAEFGWHVNRLRVGNTGVQILFRSLPFGFTFAYIPKGPVGPDWMQLWPEVDRLCRQKRAVLLKVEPDVDAPIPSEKSHFLTDFYAGADPIQPRRTIIVSLDGGEDQWLARMKQKTRYNIRLAEKKNVIVRASQDLDTFYRLMESTSQRDGFGIHSLAYFRRAYEIFHPKEMCELFLAEYDKRPLAGLMVFARGSRAWYFYGASNDEERNRMPAYLLQWEAMRWAKSHGCKVYDLWGVPDAEESVLEAGFESRSDGLWGVYRFKRGFGGELVRSAGAWDRAYLPVYPLYKWWSKRRHETG